MNKRRLSAMLLAAGLGLFSTLRATAEAPVEAARDAAWLPSFSVSMLVNQQRAEGNLSSSLATDTVSNNDPTPIPLSANEHDDYFAAVIPIALQLESPVLDVPLLSRGPRASLEAAYHFVPITGRDFLVDGKFVPLPPDPTAASQGLGGEIRVDLQHQWSITAGLGFSFEVFEIPIQIRPAISYLGQWIRADSKVIGVQIGTDELFTLGAEDSKAIHYLGPRLTLEAEAGRMEDVRFVFFLEGAAYSSRVAGKQRLRGRVEDSGETAQFRYAPDAMLYQAGIGVRFYWDPVRR